MEVYKIKITPQAHRQMSEVFSYIKYVLKAPIAAEHFLSEIEKAVFSLDVMPDRVALTNEEPWRSHGIRKLPVKNCIVYFVINNEKKEVNIIAVIYAKREQFRQLEKSLNNATTDLD